ncbi:hypothetical protein AB0M39_35165 [Streptomyces sp. NPDC051907]|uniref:hypothetical protein n=1 Tax=Streptomyces sp. NPDC051907 TaxID=3155284 RepID=UPI003425368B
MRVEISMHDIPEEAREVIRLQNQRILRLESAVQQLVSALTENGRVEGATAEAIARLADGSRHHRLITRTAVDWTRTSADDAWTRTDEPDWQWESLAEEEAHEQWLRELKG